MAREVVTDLQILPDGATASPRLQITPDSATTSPSTFYVTTDGTFLGKADATEQERISASYRVDVTLGPAGGSLPRAIHVVVSWPPTSAGTGVWPARESSIYEAIASLTPQ